MDAIQRTQDMSGVNVRNADLLLVQHAAHVARCVCKVDVQTGRLVSGCHRRCCFLHSAKSLPPRQRKAIPACACLREVQPEQSKERIITAFILLARCTAAFAQLRQAGQDTAVYVGADMLHLSTNDFHGDQPRNA